MSNQSISDHNAFTDNISNQPRGRSYDLTGKLLSQFLHNNDYGQSLSYTSFPSNHPGHLDLQRRIRFVSIIRSSILADQYRFGSSLGTFYIKNTYRHPIITSEMIGVVMSEESVSY